MPRAFNCGLQFEIIYGGGLPSPTLAYTYIFTVYTAIHLLSSEFNTLQDATGMVILKHKICYNQKYL